MSTTKSILIIGGSGTLGTHLALKLRDDYKVFTTFYSRPIRIPGTTCIPLSVDDREWAKRIAFTARPEVIVYAAGRDDRYWAERNNRDAERIHGAGAATVAHAADLLHPRFIYLSNPYVFDGTRGNYKETDIVLPDSALGKAKVAGENYIRGRSLNYIILRSSPFIGRSTAQGAFGSSLLDRIRMALDRGQRVPLPNYELHSYVPVQGLCDAVTALIESGIKNRVFHYGGLSKITQYELGVVIARRFGYDPKLIVPLADPSASPSDPDRATSELSDRRLAIPDYSLNFTQAVQQLKVKPMELERGIELLAARVSPRGI